MASIDFKGDPDGYSDNSDVDGSEDDEAILARVRKEYEEGTLWSAERDAVVWDAIEHGGAAGTEQGPSLAPLGPGAAGIALGASYGSEDAPPAEESAVEAVPAPRPSSGKSTAQAAAAGPSVVSLIGAYPAEGGAAAAERAASRLRIASLAALLRQASGAGAREGAGNSPASVRDAVAAGIAALPELQGYRAQGAAGDVAAELALVFPAGDLKEAAAGGGGHPQLREELRAALVVVADPGESSPPSSSAAGAAATGLVGGCACVPLHAAVAAGNLSTAHALALAMIGPRLRGGESGAAAAPSSSAQASPSPLDVADGQGHTPLMRAAAAAGRSALGPAVAAALTAHGADPAAEWLGGGPAGSPLGLLASGLRDALAALRLARRALPALSASTASTAVARRALRAASRPAALAESVVAVLSPAAPADPAPSAAACQSCEPHVRAAAAAAAALVAEEDGSVDEPAPLRRPRRSLRTASSLVAAAGAVLVARACYLARNSSSAGAAAGGSLSDAAQAAVVYLLLRLLRVPAGDSDVSAKPATAAAPVACPAAAARVVSRGFVVSRTAAERLAASLRQLQLPTSAAEVFDPEEGEEGEEEAGDDATAGESDAEEGLEEKEGEERAEGASASARLLLDAVLREARGGGGAETPEREGAQGEALAWLEGAFGGGAAVLDGVALSSDEEWEEKEETGEGEGEAEVEGEGEGECGREEAGALAAYHAILRGLRPAAAQGRGMEAGARMRRAGSPSTEHKSDEDDEKESVDADDVADEDDDVDAELEADLRAVGIALPGRASAGSSAASPSASWAVAAGKARSVEDFLRAAAAATRGVAGGRRDVAVSGGSAARVEDHGSDDVDDDVDDMEEYEDEEPLDEDALAEYAEATAATAAAVAAAAVSVSATDEEDCRTSTWWSARPTPTGPAPLAAPATTAAAAARLRVSSGAGGSAASDSDDDPFARSGRSAVAAAAGDEGKSLFELAFGVPQSDAEAASSSAPRSTSPDSPSFFAGPRPETVSDRAGPEGRVLELRMPAHAAPGSLWDRMDRGVYEPPADPVWDSEKEVELAQPEEVAEGSFWARMARGEDVFADSGHDALAPADDGKQTQ